MSAISSKTVPAFDITAEAFRAAAGDLGEVIAHLSGGIAPDPDTKDRLLGSMRSIQSFLRIEADEQRGREDILSDEVLANAVRQIAKPVTLRQMPVRAV
ncbi:hypothetical protein AQS8620_01453 [Aquimixticola soesokkakensis]|uniref:Uncharacterized protein n=1 Tax=Aquimixticola soesokkakensis TaxID=1519096 RepID=A0A1Y5SEY9_9RHOB|nr:hypothetical protein [Aquimixticola soesokkakensis]SLN38466.1 hypothetical protein AQS8620_01453 [Aquimixticola soesokkakensis]